MSSVYGWIASSITIIYKLPQIYKLYKTKKSDDLSVVPPVLWTHIHSNTVENANNKDENVSYSMNLIRMFKGCHMPLHDHPNMYGINYILTGKVLSQGYDFLSMLDQQDREEFQLIYIMFDTYIHCTLRY